MIQSSVSQPLTTFSLEYATPDDLRAFVHEIDVMKSVGKHPNIVGLVGHSQTQQSTRSMGPMMILIEFCGKGNLLNLLR